MKRLLSSLIIFFTLSSIFAQGNMERGFQYLRKNRGQIDSYPRTAQLLIEDGLYFTATAYLKEYLFRVEGNKAKRIDQLIDRVITHIGIKQFDVMPKKVLEKSQAPMVRYILAKKYFRRGEYKKVLRSLNGTIPASHPAKPFALLLEGSTFALMGKNKSARAAFSRCIEVTNDSMSGATERNRLRQLSINRDYCIVGIPRVSFAAKKFDNANSEYLDLPKDSYIWPEILFEEAWNSFYLRDFNRTLGKLVTYNAPVMSYIFNPETEVLKALTYMELCLFDDAKKVVNDFYSEYQSDSLSVKDLVRKYGRNYKYYYLMMKSKINGKYSGNELLNNFLDYIKKDAAFRELLESFNKGREEIMLIKSSRNKALKRVFLSNLKQALLLQRDLIGAYIRKTIIQFSRELEKSFEGMSYIKLEILARKKDQIYNQRRSYGFRSRGDIQNLKRTDKQYFWTFNGEFWADELGDYVFSLKTECRDE